MNTRYSALKNEIALSLWQRWNHQVFSLVSMDLDGFIYHNDAFGHQEGDKTLTHIDSALSAMAREHQAICRRAGGDEFLLYGFSGAGNSQADLGRRTQQCFRDLRIPHVSQGYRDRDKTFPAYMTATMAVVVFPLGRFYPPVMESGMQRQIAVQQNEATIDALIRLADHMVACAKMVDKGRMLEIDLC